MSQVEVGTFVFILFYFISFFSVCSGGSNLEPVEMQASSICVATKVPFRVKSQHTQAKHLGSMAEATAPKWAQKTITLPPQRRGCHLVTSKVS